MIGLPENVESTPEQRRMRTLRDLALDAGRSESLEACLQRAANTLSSNARDLPFVLFYVVDAEVTCARLVAQVGLPRGALACPERIELSHEGGWPLRAALSIGRPELVRDVQTRFAGLTGADNDAPIAQAYVLPIGASSSARALVIAGVSPLLALDEGYTLFYELLAAGLMGLVANTLICEHERTRAAAAGELHRAKTAFFSNVSYEFRTPLTLILGSIEDELAESEPRLPPGRYARLQTAHRNGLRLLRMVNALLDFSHIEAGRMQALFEPVDLADVTEDLASSFREPIERAGLRLSTRLEPLPEAVYVDREMWTKIVLNLLSNALKHTFKGGITVSLYASDADPEFVELRVDDTGTGIPEAELPRLFQRFHRVKGARSRSQEGTGIGLALIRALATLHGGSVGVTSREGLGSSFCVRVRRGTAHLAPERVRAAARGAALDSAHVAGYVDEALSWSSESLGASEGKNLDIEASDDTAVVSGPRASVLLADSHTDMRSYIARLLGRAYSVRAVADGEAALQAAVETPPDIIVLDVTLPGRDGLDLLKALRAGERTCLIPVILLSARADEDAALEGLDAGADDYVVKPFSGKALLARVRCCLALAKLRRESADKLAEANRELEAFSYSVSHDLRAPLRAIDGFSKALLSDYGSALDDQGRRYLERVRSGTQRMAELIDDLLNLSRITRAPLVRERVDLSGISRRVLRDLAAADPQRQVDVRVSDALSARGDSRLVSVVLENLLGNAWKFTSKRESARIEVSSELQSGETVYCIRDNGAGFNMDYAKRLFTPFQRLHSASEFQGTGIGLATVHRVITRHAGRVWAQSAPDQGAAFYFTLAEAT